MKNDVLIRFFEKVKDHYWDTLEQDRSIILVHIKQIIIKIEKEIYNENGKEVSEMKTGTLTTIRRLQCPYCDHSDEADEVGQYQGFDCTEADDLGTVQIWKCLKCKRLFKIYFE